MLLLKLGDTLLVGHVRAHLDQLGSQLEVLVADLCVLELFFGDRERSWLMLRKGWVFFL